MLVKKNAYLNSAWLKNFKRWPKKIIKNFQNGKKLIFFFLSPSYYCLRWKWEIFGKFQSRYNQFADVAQDFFLNF